MSNDNPYRAPAADVADVSVDGELELAGRGSRLGASMIDGLILMVFIVPIMFAFGMFNAERLQHGGLSFGATIAMQIVVFVIFALVQTYFLKASGQTIGKKLVGIRIVGLDDQQPSIGTLLFARYAPMYLINAIPLVGGLAGFADILFIFGSERRCIHDRIAKTKVVVVSK